MNTYRADLHIHTVLSPCAEIEMLPPLIVQEAIERGIQVIAITDHNATANIAAVQKAAAGRGLFVLPGMELQTREEVHVLCLFDTLDQINAFQSWVDASLPDIANNADLFGMQLIVDSEGQMVAEEKRLLLTSSDVSIEQAFQKTAALEGLCIPAHVDRKGFGLIAMLGLVPLDIKVEALEISRHITPEAAYRSIPQIEGYPLIQDGDAHRLDEFLGSTYFEMEEPSVAEIRMALSSSCGRSIRIVR